MNNRREYFRMFIGKMFFCSERNSRECPIPFLDQKEISREVPNVTNNLNGSFMRADAPELVPGTLKNFVIEKKIAFT